MNLPWAEAAEQNKAVIYQAIRPYLRGVVLEIASGTGQHAEYFAGLEPGIVWQTSDLDGNIAGLEARIRASGLPNLPPPLTLDVQGVWPRITCDFIFTANSFHIMDDEMVSACIDGVGRSLRPGGAFAVYGPFNYHGAPTSSSNADFDRMLRSRNPKSGLKDYDRVSELALTAGLEAVDDVTMPQNNRTLIWQKRT